MAEHDDRKKAERAATRAAISVQKRLLFTRLRNFSIEDLLKVKSGRRFGHRFDRTSSGTRFETETDHEILRGFSSAISFCTQGAVASELQTNFTLFHN